MIRVSLCTVMLSLALAGCTDDAVGPDRTQPPRDLSAAEKQLVESDNQFGLSLFRTLNAQQADANVFISPLSVSMALGMTLNGAEGSTRAEMEEALALTGLDEQTINTSYQSLIELLDGLDPKVTFELANSIWYRQGFDVQPPFLETNQTYFDAEVAALDFNRSEAPATINRWVDEKTHSKIQKIIDGAIDPNTMLYLINAIYFKGDWTYAFDEDETRDDTFTRRDGSTASVPMMRQETDLPYVETERFQAVDLPYGDSLYSMTIVLPRSGTEINDLVGTIDQATWDAWAAQFRTRGVALELPKFKLEYKASLAKVLRALGMEAAFNPAVSDFSAINPDWEDLHISDVLHKTFLEIDEQGTEAAAVTSVEVGVTSIGGGGPIPMRVDRPFVLVIRERHSGTILFIGKVLDPAV